MAYRRFALDPERGVSLARWRECVAWLAEPGNVAAETYAVLVFRTHVGGYRGEPPWLEEGCRFGAVEPIGEDPWELLEAELMKFARFQVAFCEMCFRVEAARGGSPRERQMRAFRRAMQREDISRDAKSVDSAEKGEKDKVMRMYDPDYVPTSESETTVIERATTREVHEKEEEEETVEDVPDVGESWVPVSKLNKFKEAARVAKAAAALGGRRPPPRPPRARARARARRPGCRRELGPREQVEQVQKPRAWRKPPPRREEGARARARAARPSPSPRPRRGAPAEEPFRDAFGEATERAPSAAAWCRAARRRRRRRVGAAWSSRWW